MSGASDAPRISVAAGITVGLIASFVQSLGLTIQRKSHLQNDSLPLSSRRSDWHRPLWLVGFAIYFTSNILGSIFQIGALPLVILGPLGAVSLLWNAILARFLLGDLFSYHLLVGTVLIAGGAVLIGYFGVVPEPAHPLEYLIRLYSRPAFIIEFLVLCVAIGVVCVSAHLAEWRLEKRLREELGDELGGDSEDEEEVFGGKLENGDRTDSTVKQSRRRSIARARRPRALSLPPLALPTPTYPLIDPASVPRTTVSELPPSLSTPPQSPDRASSSISPPPAFVAPTIAVPTPIAPPIPPAGEKPLRGFPSAVTVARTRLLVGVAYGSASGTLSGICLLFAKTGVELLILTVVGVENEFAKWQTWVIVGALVAAAVLQLWYLNKALRLVGPTLICPLAFCFYNLSGILNGLVYYDQVKLLSALQIGLVVLGTAVLLSGVWVVSIRAGSPAPGHDDDQVEEAEAIVGLEGVDLQEDEATERTPLIGSRTTGTSHVAFSDEPTEIESGRFDADEVSTDEDEWTDEERERRRKQNDFKRTIEQVYRMFVDEEHSGVRGLSIGLGAASPGFAIRPAGRQHTINPRLSSSLRAARQDSLSQLSKTPSVSSNLPMSDSLPILPPAVTPPSSPETQRRTGGVVSPRSRFESMRLSKGGRTTSEPMVPPTVGGMTASMSSEGTRQTGQGSSSRHRRRSSRHDRRHAPRLSISGDPYVGVGDEASKHGDWVFGERTAPLVRERPEEESLLVRAGEVMDPEEEDEEDEGPRRGVGRVLKRLLRWPGSSSRKGKGVD